MRFGTWLVAQAGRGDWIGALATMAAKDPAFPTRGSADDVRGHLSRAEADADLFEALDDAELLWAAEQAGALQDADA